jgi:hypothetical protein
MEIQSIPGSAFPPLNLIRHTKIKQEDGDLQALRLMVFLSIILLRNIWFQLVSLIQIHKENL